ncbi:hypothetical protein V6N11_051408 [Hibiscus sabdariffa]|uniref:Uncharacterized protein n=1 Tax=Hibiscus sabdariffa TaxID=183260 RepID=A0ABR2U709_9ROSI
MGKISLKRIPQKKKIRKDAQRWHTPLEVPGNRLPETGSKWILLHTRGAWIPARSDQPRQTKEVADSSRKKLMQL